MSMQNCNLLNLPENYQMKYCKTTLNSSRALETIYLFIIGSDHSRLISRFVMASIVIRCRRSQGQNCRLCVGQNVCIVELLRQ